MEELWVILIRMARLQRRTVSVEADALGEASSLASLSRPGLAVMAAVTNTPLQTRLVRLLPALPHPAWRGLWNLMLLDRGSGLPTWRSLALPTPPHLPG